MAVTCHFKNPSGQANNQKGSGGVTKCCLRVSRRAGCSVMRKKSPERVVFELRLQSAVCQIGGVDYF